MQMERQLTREKNLYSCERFIDLTFGKLTPPKLNIRKEESVLMRFIDIHGFSKGLIDIYDHWIDNILPKRICKEVYIEPNGVKRYFRNVRFKTPEKTPYDCQLYGYSYLGKLIADIYSCDDEEETIFKKDFLIAELPVMLGSKYSHLYDLTDEQKIKLKECPNDPFGYFIIAGTARVINIQEGLRLLVSHTFVSMGELETRMTCPTYKGTTVTRITVSKQLTSLRVELQKLNHPESYPLVHIYIYLVNETLPEKITKDRIRLYGEEFFEKYIKLFCKEEELPLISNMFRITITDAKIEPLNIKRGEHDYIRFRRKIIEDLYSHIPEEYKLYMLAYCAVKTIRYQLGLRPQDQRDSWGNKRLDTAGKSMEKLFNAVFHDVFDKMISVSEKVTVNDENRITNLFINSFQPNNWGYKGSKENISDFLKRENPISVYSQIRRVNTPISRQSKQDQLRMLQPSQIGYICVSETPEGKNLGLLKYLAISCIISSEREEDSVIELLRREGVSEEPPGLPIAINGVFRFWGSRETVEDKDIFGRNLYHIEKLLKEEKRAGSLPRDSCVFYNHLDDILEYYCDSSRPMRPLLVVKNNRLLIDEEDAWDMPIEELKAKGIIELVDAREQEFIMLASEPEKVRERERQKEVLRNAINFEDKENRVKEIVNFVSENKSKYLNEIFIDTELEEVFFTELIAYSFSTLAKTGKVSLEDSVRNAKIRVKSEYLEKSDQKQSIEMKKTNVHEEGFVDKIMEGVREQFKRELNKLESSIPFTHSEISPTAIFGVAGSLQPRPNCSQGPRATYQASMCKQALGMYHFNRHLRFDTSFKIMVNPSRPIFETSTARISGLNSAPTGTMVICAFLALFDNNEDAIIVNKEVIDNGYLDIIKYSTYKIEVGPDEVIRKTKNTERFSAIGEDGLPKLDHYVYPGYCLLSKSKKSDEKDTSVFAGIDKYGYVDRVIVYRDASGVVNVKIKLRQFEKYKSGDKLASRYAQKGTVSRIIHPSELPMIYGGPNHGIRPHFFLNPHSIPSRMSVNKLQEMLLSKAALYTGERGDGTSFVKFDLDKWKSILEKNGLNGYGNETLIWPNGKKIENVFVAPCYYQCLKHHSKDKFQMRARGAIMPITHQPVGGRSREGGLKLGEMERDGLISHGASGLVLERFIHASDAYKIAICTVCGNIATPVMKQGKRFFECRICKEEAKFVHRTIPYVLKVVIHLLNGMMINTHFKVEEFPKDELTKKYEKYSQALI